MSNDDLDVRGAFAKGTHPAPPALAARVRSAILEDAETPRARGMWLAGAVALVLSAAIVAALLATGTGRGPAGNRDIAPAATPTASASATPAAPQPSPSPVPVRPVPTSTPSPDSYSCSATAGGGSGLAPVSRLGVRVGTQQTYDRLVIQFDGPVPQYEVRPQPSSTFVLDPSGRAVTLRGSAGIIVRVHNAAPSGSYAGPNDYLPGYPVLLEARQLSDFEGVFSWGLGVAGPACYKVSILRGPDRLVVDLVRAP